MQKTLKASIVNALSCLLLLSVVSGCASQTKPIQVTSKPIDKPVLMLPKADVVYARDVEWIVITPNNYQAVFDQLSKDRNQVVLFAVTPDGYKNMALNLSDIRAYIEQQQSIILAYESYYRKSSNAIDAANAEIANLSKPQ